MDKEKNILNNISSSRLFIFGVAIIWIVLYHANFSGFPLFIQFPFFNIGYGGVDIFVLLSGFGIFCSLDKNYDELNFYRKRFIRLLPTIPIIMLFICFMHINSLHEIIGYILNLNYFVSENYSLTAYKHFWYIPAISFFYLISPILFNIIKKHKDIICSLIIISLLGIIPFLNHPQLIMIARLPLFILGMYLGLLYKEKFYITSKKIFWANILAIISFIALILIYILLGDIKYKYGLIRYPFYFIAPALCINLSIIYKWLELHKIFNYLIKPIEYIGINSLEIYLVDAILSCGCMSVLTTLMPLQKVITSIMIGCFYGITFRTIKRGLKNAR